MALPTTMTLVLNASGYPGQASPINLDSIEQLNVRVAPSSIEYSNFEGGVIEVVTKGGTNDFKGSVYSYDRGDSFVGDSVDGRDIDQEFDDTSEGFTYRADLLLKIKHSSLWLLKAMIRLLPLTTDQSAQEHLLHNQLP